MNVTFLVTINLDSLDTLQDTADDIESLLGDRYEIKEVRPWARPTVTPPVNPLQSLPSLTETKPTQ